MNTAIVRTATKVDAIHIHQFIVELAIYENAEHEVKSTVADIENTLFSDGCTAHALMVDLDGEPMGMAVYFFNYSTWKIFTSLRSIEVWGWVKSSWCNWPV
jgi:hypothetical protein